MMKTILKDRELWYDGTSVVSPDLVPNLLLHGLQPNNIVVTEINDDIALFNSLSDIMIDFSKTENKPLNLDYAIPDSYKTLDLTDYINVLLKNKKLNDTYAIRVNEELNEIKSRDMEMLIKTLIYLVDRLRSNNVVWGVGRGSSCASLILYLIGIHSVDPVKYHIDLSEFFH